jgi:uncharacterized membrane protein
MSKRADMAIAIVILVALFGLSSGYDFWRGYHYTQSIGGGVAFTLFGFVVLLVLGLFMYLFSKRPRK